MQSKEQREIQELECQLEELYEELDLLDSACDDYALRFEALKTWLKVNESSLSELAQKQLRQIIK